MTFRTRLDYSNNRQVKQFTRTDTQLSGATEFGVPFSALTSGPDLNNVNSVTGATNVISTYSGNTGYTSFSFGYPPMISGETYISAFTSSNSGITQHITSDLVPNNTTTIDGNLVVLDYIGIKYDIRPINMYSGSGSTFTGSAYTNVVEFITAGTLDFTGRTIWVDVNGISRTEKLIVTDSPQVGYVLTCLNNEGMVGYMPVSSSYQYWTAGTGSHSGSAVTTITNKLTNGYTSGYGSVGEGIKTRASGDASHSEGTGTQAIGNYSHAEGRDTKASGEVSHAEGGNTIASGDYSHVEGNYSEANGDYSHAGGEYSQANGYNSFIHSFGTFDSSGPYSIVNSDYGAVLGGQDGYLSSSATNSVLLGGNSLSGYSANTVYVPYLNINSLATGSASYDIGINSNGFVVDTASDISLKENVEPIKSALNKVLNMSGVTFNWKNNGEKDIGFIAQDVENIEPLLTRNIYKSELKTVKYKNFPALLLEAIKEMYNDGTYDRRFTSTESIVAEDNNIDLNFNGNHETSIGGGINVINGISNEENSEILTNNKGLFEIKPGIESKRIININNYTPNTTNDDYGEIGETVWDDNYIYIKTNSGWKRSKLENF